MSDQWYYGSDGQQRGPIDAAEIRACLASGAIRVDDLVWREGMAEWTPAARVPDFADVVSSAPPPPPVAATAGYAPQYATPGVYADASGQPLGYYAATQGGVEYVGFWWRVLAALIDGIVTGIAGAIVGGVVGGIMGATMGTGQEAIIAIQIVSQILGILIGWLYSALLESSAQQATLGKMAIGVRVTNLNGERLTFARATGRFFAKYLSYLTFFIGFIMVGLTQRKQGLHDLVAGTLVLRGRPNMVIHGFDVAAPTAMR